MRFRNLFLRSGNIEGSGGAAPSATPAASEGPSQGEQSVETGIADILNFDPFDPGFKVEGDSTVEAAPEVQAPVGADSIAASAPPAPAQPSGQDALTAAAQALRETATALPGVVREAVTPRTATPQEDPWRPMDGENVLDYAQIFGTIPDALVAAVGSENSAERKQAISQMMAISTHMAHRLAVKQSLETMQAMLTRALPEYVSRAMDQHTTGRTVFQDFYGKYPALDNDGIRPVVMNIAKQLAQETGATNWTPQLRDQLGQRVMAYLSGVVGATPPAVQPTGPRMTPATARPAQPATSSVENEMFDLLGG